MSLQATLSFSELALAAYATLIRGATGAQLAALRDARVGMSPTQAEEFAALFPTVVASYNDLPTTGFQATVFKDTSGNLTLAFRGTENSGGDIVPAGADMLFSGAAYDQIVAMVNWWKRASAVPGDMVQQFRLASYSVDLVPADAVVLHSDDQMEYMGTDHDIFPFPPRIRPPVNPHPSSPS